MSNNKKLYKLATSGLQYGFRPNLFLWPSRTLFFGPLGYLQCHAMGAVAINVGLYQPFQLRAAGGQFREYRCAIIPAGVEHELNANGNLVASLLIEKHSPDFARINPDVPLLANDITALQVRDWVSTFQQIYEEKLPKATIQQLINHCLDTDEDAVTLLDSRVENVMQAIKDDAYNAMSQEELAALVGLSTSRFRHLFKAFSGVPYRRYRMWKRLLSAVETLHRVDNMTYSALEAGFTDSAHFNRCFRKTLGLNPSLVFKHLDRFEV